MFDAKSYPTKALRIALILVAVFVMFQSVESLMQAKDSELFEAWVRESGQAYTLSDYTTLIIARMFFSIAIPVFYAVYAYFANKKLGFSNIAKWVWTLLLLYAAMMKGLELRLGSVFWYVLVIALIGLLIVNLSLERFQEVERRRR